MTETTLKLSASLKARWVKALRSGKFKQSTGTLKDVNNSGDVVGYCCLGVLCAISKPVRDQVDDWECGGALLCDQLGNSVVLPRDVQDTLAEKTTRAILSERSPTTSSARRASESHRDLDRLTAGQVVLL